jgi:hypothetical protein
MWPGGKASGLQLALVGERLPDLPALVIILDEYAELVDSASDATGDADSIAHGDACDPMKPTTFAPFRSYRGLKDPPRLRECSLAGRYRTRVCRIADPVLPIRLALLPGPLPRCQRNHVSIVNQGCAGTLCL